VIAVYGCSMSRGIGAFDAIESVLPDAVALLAALATQLGDVWFVGALLVGLHWYADDEVVDRDAVATIAGLTIGALGLAFALKYAFTLPRPPTRLARPDQFPGVLQPLYVATGTASSYGFPSGHAVTSTVVYGLLAQRLSIRTRRWRYGVAAAIVTLVCATRVVLGVHYLVDVVAGAALGAAYVAGTYYALALVDDAATAAFGIATGIGAVALAVIGVTPDSVALLGTAFVGLAWRLGIRRRDAASASASS